MPFLALLKLIPLKDWLYGSAIVALLIGFGVYTAHERGVGEAKEIAAVAKAVAVQNTKTQKVVLNANLQIQAANAAANAAMAVAPADSPSVIVRYGTSEGACAVLPARSSGSGQNAPAESSVEHTIDIGPPLDTIGRDADAEIVYLQTYIKACQTAGYCKK